MSQKIRVGILAGGKSSEHEISCASAGGLLAQIDRNRFEPILIGITKAGDWVYPPASQQLSLDGASLPEIIDGAAVDLDSLHEQVDVIFPVLHGPYGEDGTVQGLLEMRGIKYVASGVLASSIAMDKDFAKAIFQARGLPTVAGIIATSENQSQILELIAAAALTFPIFIKPARGGSSRGTHKANSPADVAEQLADALRFDTKVMIEQGVAARELECAVLQTADGLLISPVGEIKVLGDHPFYDFAAKYFPGGSELVEAQLPAQLAERIRQTAATAFAALGCEGLARVDFFLDKNSGELFLNEINTMPGFTPMSVYPKLMAKAGISYGELITKLIDLAISRSASVTR
jgi:D-alanine-D-alanine ligase